LRYLKHGELGIADREFNIADDLSLVGVTLAIPPFTKENHYFQKKMLSFLEAISVLEYIQNKLMYFPI